jgi:hypothetical protein
MRELRYLFWRTLFLGAVALPLDIKSNDQYVEPGVYLTSSPEARSTIEIFRDQLEPITHCLDICSRNNQCLGLIYSDSNIYCQETCRGSCVYFDQKYLPHQTDNYEIALKGTIKFKKNIGNILRKRDCTFRLHSNHSGRRCFYNELGESVGKHRFNF